MTRREVVCAMVTRTVELMAVAESAGLIIQPPEKHQRLISIANVSDALADEPIAEVVEQVLRQHCGISHDDAFVVVHEMVRRQLPGKEWCAGIIFIAYRP